MVISIAVAQREYVQLNFDDNHMKWASSVQIQGTTALCMA